MMKFMPVFLGFVVGIMPLIVLTIRKVETPETPPAFLIVLGDVHDRSEFMRGYAGKLPPVYDQYGGTYLAVGGGDKIEVLEGQNVPSSYVISRWDSMDAAREFWNSPEYAPLKTARIDNAWGDFDVFLVEGQPKRR